MAKPLRSQLNQIRAWVRQGRTDAWIAHQLEVSTNELREFRRRHELDSDEEEQTGEVDLRDEIEAEIEAATREEELAAAEADDDEEDSDDGDDDEADEGTTDEDAGDDDDDAEARPRRRRRRRGGRGRSRSRAGDSEGDSDGEGSRDGGREPAKTLQGTFDHGDTDGYGLWLDPSVADDPVYSKHWAGKRRVEVTIEADRIVIKRSR